MTEPQNPRRNQTLDDASRASTDTARSGAELTVDPASTTPSTSAKSAAPLPATIGRFQVRALLGEGGFGRVYKAFDPDLHREVALKVPLPGVLSTALRRERFLREARAAAGLHHPNICPVYEVGKEAEQPFIVMAFVPGSCLASVLQNRPEPLSVKQSVGLLRRIALGVHAAHAKGVVHRDLKPANIIIDRERKEPVITDFGLARLTQEGTTNATHSGSVLGTPSYMAPEQALGAQEQIDARTDVYSLGVIFFELLTGELPFRGRMTEVLGMHIAAERPKPSEVRPGLDPSLDAICTKAMAKNPVDRYPSAQALAAALDDFLRSADLGTTLSKSQSITLPAAPPPAAHVSVELVASPGVPPVAISPASVAVPAFEFVPEPEPESSPEPESRRNRKGHGSRRRNKLGLAIGGSLAAVAVLVGVVFVLTRNKPTPVRNTGDGKPDVATLATGPKVEPTPATTVPTPSIQAPPAKTTESSATPPPVDLESVRKAVTRVLRMNGEVTVSDSTGRTLLLRNASQVIEGMSITRIKLANLSNLTGREFEDIFPFAPALQWLELSGRGLRDGDFVHFKGLNSLRQLTLSNIDGKVLTGAGLAHVADLPRLTSIRAPDCALSDHAAPQLARMPALNDVYMPGSRFSTAGVIKLSKSPTITRLEISGSPMKDEGLKAIAGMMQLRRLVIANTSITDAGLQALKGHPNLEFLYVAGNALTGKAFAPLATLQRLNHIIAYNNQIADADIPILGQLTNLGEISLYGNKLTPAGLKDLQKLLPKCSIWPRPPADSQ